MADIKRALREIPEKQAGEEPADEGQKGYLRSFGYFSEKLIKELGALQAAYLIDEAELIKEEGSANIDAQRKRAGRRGGFRVLMVLLIVLVLAGAVVRFFLESENDELGQHSERKSEVNSPEASEKIREEKAGPEGRVTPVPEPVSDSVGESLDLASIQYPADVVAIERFDLLNNEGKETSIKVGTPIRIEKRSELGTLTMEIDGKLFVGNESRLIGKIQVR